MSTTSDSSMSRQTTSSYLVPVGVAVLADAAFVRDGEGWRISGFGTCEWRDDGYTVSPWTFDPENPVDPASTEISVLTGDECASHTRFGNEYLVVVAGTGDEVELVVWRANQPPPPPEGPGGHGGVIARLER